MTNKKDCYILYDPDMWKSMPAEKSAGYDAKGLREYYGGECRLLPVTSCQSFGDAWDTIGTGENPTGMVVILTHGDPGMLVISRKNVAAIDAKVISGGGYMGATPETDDGYRRKYDAHIAAGFSETEALGLKDVAVPLLFIACCYGADGGGKSIANAFIQKTSVAAVIAGTGKIANWNILGRHIMRSKCFYTYKKDIEPVPVKRKLVISAAGFAAENKI